MKVQSPEAFGIYSKNPERLRQRYRISKGVELLGSDQAESMGYRPVPKGAAGIVIASVDKQDPLASLQVPTHQELTAITATPNTKRAIQIVKLRAEAAERFQALCFAAEAMDVRPEDTDPYIEFVPGIIGVARGVRVDAPGQLSATFSSRYPDKKVGDHIDTWDDVDTSFIIANMGPGDRWHRVIPALNRVALGGASIAAQADYATKNAVANEIPVHWFKLAAPADGYVEAALNLPVAWATHDGSTIGSDMQSQALMGIMSPVEPNALLYPSIV